jgi:hypothetical protein
VKHNEVYNVNGIRGTPLAVVINRDGVGSVTAFSPVAIEELIRLTLRREESWSEERPVA